VRIAPLILAVIGLLIVAAAGPVALAQGAPHSAPGRCPAFDQGFLDLKILSGAFMGEPTECPHPSDENGDILQQTTTGLAYYRNGASVPIFTSGNEHWALLSDRVVYRTGDSVDPPPAVSASRSPAGQQDDWQVYVNTRFRFSIRFPRTWSRGEESFNGDGAPLYAGNLDVRVSAYGSYLYPGADPYERQFRPGFRSQRIKLDSDLDAVLIVGRENDRVVQDMVLLSRDVEYHVYVEVDDRFWRENEAVLMSVIRSFRLLD
jgi:hypothetical protein